MTPPNEDIRNQLLATFRAEAQEHLDTLNVTALELEQAGAGAREKLIERLLRTCHTLKGAAQAVGMPELERLCHGLESFGTALKNYGPAGLPSAGSSRPGAIDLLQSALQSCRTLILEPTPRSRNL